jgi:hypothetical protein
VTQPSFDKQYVRDWLDASGWDHEPPPPELPSDRVQRTAATYRDAYERVTGDTFARYLQRMGIAATEGDRDAADLERLRREHA